MRMTMNSDLQDGYNKLVSARAYCLAYGHEIAVWDEFSKLTNQIICEAGGSLDIDSAYEGGLAKWQQLREAGHGKAVSA